MDEPALDNRSGFRATVLPILDGDGAESRVAIVKATFSIVPGKPLTLADRQRDVRLGDVTWGAPEIADIRLPGDFCFAKTGTDVVLAGHAVPHARRPATHVDVAIRIGDRRKALRVHGPRRWRRSFNGVVPGPSAAAEPTPLAWSRAYGGLDLSDPDRPQEEPRNPVGTGVARRPERLVETPAPQIEAPEAPIGAAGGSHVPAGCAPLGRHFEPRRQSAGTYDAAWLKSRYPGRPSDYRLTHENCAAPGLVFAEALRGGEPVELSGVGSAGPMAFELPKLLMRIDAMIDGRRVERRPQLDTVIVDSDELMLEMVWRALFRCPPKMRDRFAEIRVEAKTFVA